MRNLLPTALVLFLILAPILPLAANTFLATPAPGDSAVNLRQAINDANAHPGPDVVQVAAGTYLLENALSDDNGVGGDLDLNDDLTIEGAGAGTTIIDGGGLARVLDLNGSSTVTIADVTIRNGQDTNGGCISGGGGTLVLTRVVVRDGEASGSGGAVYLSGGSLVAHDCEFLDSSAQRGGGLYLLDSSAALHHSTVAGNSVGPGSAGQGGGIYYRDNSGGDELLQVVDSVIRDNTATDDGGGIENYQGEVEITRSTIRDNNSGDDGGGIENDNHNTGGFLTVTDSVFFNNSAMNGGAIDNDGVTTVVSTTITGNTANSTAEESWGSGGIRNSEDTPSGTSLVLTNCTVYGNLSRQGGGPLQAGDLGNISTQGAQITIQNSIVGRCYTDLTLASGSPGTMLSLGSNLLEDEMGCNKTLQAGAPPDLMGNPQLGALSDDGTAGHAHRPLTPASPAIDAGSDSAAPPADQLGQARLDGNDDDTVTPDIGAVEFPEPTFEAWLAEFFTPAQLLDPEISGPTADPDEDRRDNTAEYLADTNPEDGASLLRISEIGGVGGPVSVALGESSVNRSYTLYESDDLGTSDPWTAIAGPLRGTGGLLAVPDPGAPAGRRFYRLGATLPPTP